MHRFLAEPELAAYAALFGKAAVKATVDGVLQQARVQLGTDGDAVVPAFGALFELVRARLVREEDESLVEVVNGTGIVLHTNLGRAPLARQALEAVADIAGGYSNLEFDLAAGGRGSRYERLTKLLCASTGAEAALVVNNCAAAVLLVLDTFARCAPGLPGREVVVSRNQLIEIGGGFRLPDVLARSGATLVEVGTTNKVYARDFERALGPKTALLLRTHSSNFRIEGFTSDVSPADFAALGKRAGIPTLEDLGSGALVDLQVYGLPHERTVPEAIADGMDLVAFSGDKLLGGPQAGIIVGRTGAIARLRANPLLRALRVDKATLAALAATLRLYFEPAGVREIPIYALLAATREELRTRAQAGIEALRADFPDVSLEAVATSGYLGGGSTPLAELPSYGIAVRAPGRTASELAGRLRRSRPRVVGRIDSGALVIDLRAIPAERDLSLRRALRDVLA